MNLTYDELKNAYIKLSQDYYKLLSKYNKLEDKFKSYKDNNAYHCIKDKFIIEFDKVSLDDVEKIFKYIKR